MCREIEPNVRKHYLLCVKYDVKPYTLTHCLFLVTLLVFNISVLMFNMNLWSEFVILAHIWLFDEIRWGTQSQL